MGIYDEYRDGISTITLGGDRAQAAQYIPQARKMAEVIKGKLDLGTNLGQDYKDSVQLDKDTIMKIEMSPGVTNETLKMEIISTPPVPGAGTRSVKTQPENRCAVLPLSRPGARMFTHMFNHDVRNVFFPDDTFFQGEARVEQTPYITPTLEQGAYCSADIQFPGDGLLLIHREVFLMRDFMILGAFAKKLFLHEAWIGFLEPNVFLSFSESVMALDAPCSMNFPGFPLFTPNPESLGPGNNFALCMEKNPGGGCDKVGEAWKIHVVEGDVFIFFEEQQAEREFKEDESLETTKEEDAPASATAAEGEFRHFAAVSWTTDGGSKSDREIVLLYESGLCPAAVGFFYGGLDGLYPWEYSANTFLAPLMCKFPKPGLGPPPAIENTVPPAASPYIIGAARKGLAWASGALTRINENTDKANIHLNSRCFWFELNANGFPTGVGVHNGPIGPEGSQDGAADYDIGFPTF